MSGALDDVEFVTDPIFGFDVPTECPGIPTDLLTPRHTWSDGAEYDAKAKELAQLFVENFEEFAAEAGEDLIKAGPTI
jgi:phosphoenolpyruvate carboxykinase (ATP)